MVERLFSQLKGAEVVGARGHVFGNLVDIAIAGTKITGYLIRVKPSHAKQLGLERSFWKRWTPTTVLIRSRYVKSVSEVVVLRISLSQFARHLTEAKSTQPAFLFAAPAPAAAPAQQEETPKPAPEPTSEESKG